MLATAQRLQETILRSLRDVAAAEGALRPNVEMINGAVVLIHPPSPGVDDICGLQAGGQTEREVDVRPLVLALGGRRTDNRRSPDPLIHPGSRDKAFAEVAPLSLTEHRPSVLAATHSGRPGQVPPDQGLVTVLSSTQASATRQSGTHQTSDFSTGRCCRGERPLPFRPTRAWCHVQRVPGWPRPLPQGPRPGAAGSDDQLPVTADEGEEPGLDAKAVATEHGGATDPWQVQVVDSQLVEPLLCGAAS